MKNVFSFKVSGVQYELFFAKDDEHVEIYETENPSSGFIFNKHKDLITFVNLLTDAVEEKVG